MYLMAEESINQDFTKKVRSLKIAKNITREQVSSSSGIKISRLNNIMAARTKATKDDLDKLNKAFPDQSDTTIKNATPEQLKEIAILEARIKDLLSEKEYDKKTIDRLLKIIEVFQNHSKNNQ